MSTDASQEGKAPRGRRSRAGNAGTPTTGVPGTQDGPPAPGEEPQTPDDGEPQFDQQEPVSNYRPEAESENPLTPEDFNDPDAPANPDPATAPIGRRPGRTSNGPEPQTSFSEQVLDVEGDESTLLKMLESRQSNKAAHKLYTVADAEIKKRLQALGFYDGQPHQLRAGQFLIVLAKGDGEPAHIDFVREPSIRKTISVAEA